MRWRNNRIVGSWTTWFLDFNKRGAWNKRGGTKFGPFLINVVAEITELWVENPQKINCRDIASIREGRVVVCISALFALCRIRWNLHKLYNICTIIVYIAGVRYSVFLFSLISKKRNVISIWIQTHLKKTFNNKHVSRELLSY